MPLNNLISFLDEQVENSYRCNHGIILSVSTFIKDYNIFTKTHKRITRIKSKEKKGKMSI